MKGTNCNGSEVSMNKNSQKTKRMIRYCMRMWLLQEIAGCTFIEARIYLRKERNETPEKLMADYSISLDEYTKIEKTAISKMQAFSEAELFRGYSAIYPNEDEKSESW